MRLLLFFFFYYYVHLLDLLLFSLIFNDEGVIIIWCIDPENNKDEDSEYIYGWWDANPKTRLVKYRKGKVGCNNVRCDGLVSTNDAEEPIGLHRPYKCKGIESVGLY